ARIAPARKPVQISCGKGQGSEDAVVWTPRRVGSAWPPGTPEVVRSPWGPSTPPPKATSGSPQAQCLSPASRMSSASQLPVTPGSHARSTSLRVEAWQNFGTPSPPQAQYRLSCSYSGNPLGAATPASLFPPLPGPPLVGPLIPVPQILA
ncbi:unnamed protein product, partial [Polarella glacialis]